MAKRQSNSNSNSNSFGTARPSSPDELRSVDPARLSRYDVLLVAWLVGQLSSVPIWAAMAAGSLLAVPLVADGLAVNPPA